MPLYEVCQSLLPLFVTELFIEIEIQVGLGHVSMEQSLQSLNPAYLTFLSYFSGDLSRDNKLIVTTSA